MAFHAIAYLVTHPGRQRELAAVLQFGVQFPFQAQQDMPAPTPVVGQVTGGVLDHAHAGGAEVAGTPQGTAGNAWVKFGLDGRPVGDAKRDSGQFHGGLGRQLTWHDNICLAPAATDTDRQLL